jgi:hypothetical protein
MKTVTVFNFVLRDSNTDWILVTVWGSKEYIDNLIEEIEINSIGIISSKISCLSQQFF